MNYEAGKKYRFLGGGPGFNVHMGFYMEYSSN